MRRSAVVIPLLLAYLAALVVTGWVSDDAYITLRTVDNFVHGLGLRWNAAERVQTYTHPLWMFLIAAAYAVTREAFLTTAAIGIAVSLTAAAILAWGLAGSRFAAGLSLGALILSSSYLDYSTSGLENPLTHMLLLLFLMHYLRSAGSTRDLFVSSLLAAALALTRVDALLLVLPALIGSWWRVRTRRAAAVAALGFAPLFAWEAFSVVYYGSAVPNTAFAKMPSGFPRGELVMQGLRYLADAAVNDPVLPAVIVGAAVAVAFLRRADLTLPLLGAALYLAFLVWIGGDFMRGRFLTAPFILCLGVLVQFAPPPALPHRLVLAGLLLALGIPSAWRSLSPGASYGAQGKGVVTEAGISDERAFYYPATSLLKALRGAEIPGAVRTEAGRRARDWGDPVAVTGLVGYFGFYGGPRLHIIDHYALGDALLSRLPVVTDDPDFERLCRAQLGKPCSKPWRTGHYLRAIPRGYIATVLSRGGRIEDEELARFWDDLTLATTAPLGDIRRAGAIWRLNTRGLGRLSHPERYRHFTDPYRDKAMLAEFTAERPDFGYPWYQLGVLALEERDYAAAAGHFRKAAKAWPRFGPAWEGLQRAEGALRSPGGAGR